MKLTLLGNWYVSNVFINFFIVPCCYIINLGYFIIILNHFLVLTYWHSAKCQLLFFACFLHRGKQYQTGPNATKLYGDFLWTKRHLMGQGCAWGFDTSFCIMFSYCYLQCFIHNNAFWSNSNAFSLIICKVYTKRENSGRWKSGPGKVTSCHLFCTTPNELKHHGEFLWNI